MPPYTAPLSASDYSAGTNLATATGANAQRTIQESANEANRLRDEFNANLKKARKSAVVGDIATLAGTALGFGIPGAAPYAGVIGQTVGNLAGTPSAGVSGLAGLGAGLAQRGIFNKAKAGLMNEINNYRQYRQEGNY